MATDAIKPGATRFFASTYPRESSLWRPVERFLVPLASLKITVALLAASILLVFAGSLAQVTEDVWTVVHGYFRVWLAWVPFQIFFPRSFFPDPPTVPGGFWFPGGWAIGTAMGINLLAAHGLRFKLQATGRRLWAGWGILAIGGLITWLVVATQQDSASLQSIAKEGWGLAWTVIELALASIWFGCFYRLWNKNIERRWEKLILVMVGLTAGAACCWLLVQFVRGNSLPLGDSSMRILWQLMKAEAAALTLLAGCLLLFRRRAGIVLLHGGIGLMMANELVVHSLHVESSMVVNEAETVNYASDIRTIELAVADKSDPKMDDVVVVPRSFILQDNTISDDALPFDMTVVRYLQNSDFIDVDPTKPNPATVGAGLLKLAIEESPSTGTDSKGRVDATSAYIRLTGKLGDDLGTYLVGVTLFPQEVKVGDKLYEISLRHKRIYKPYSIHLTDFRRTNYPGTNTVKSFESFVRLTDAEQKVDREVRIWMNNPLRHAGDTLYQSGFDEVHERYTVLQIVSNEGWMIPYVGCMVVFTGMLAQFLLTLYRFVRRKSEVPVAALAVVVPRGKRRAQSPRTLETALGQSYLAALRSPSIFVPLAVILLAGGWMLNKSRLPKIADDGMDVYAFGRIPLLYEGRIKPFDTLARQTLCQIADQQTYYDASNNKLPAIRWLLDVIVRPEIAETHRVLCIDNLGIIDLFDLKRRKSRLYSIEELLPRMSDFEKQLKAAHELPKNQWGALEKEMFELEARLGRYSMLKLSFEGLPFPSYPSTAGRKTDPEAARYIDQLVQVAPRAAAMLAQREVPLAIPTGQGDKQWEPFATARDSAYIDIHIRDKMPNLATQKLASIFRAYVTNDSVKFNRAVTDYGEYLANDAPVDLTLSKTNFEAFFNNWEPFYHCSLLYVFAFVLGLASWLGWTKPLSRAAFGLLAFAFVVHSVAVVARMYISGRPPITNLYTTALFVGWAGVLAGLLLEAVYRLGFGNLLASITGFATLLVAHLLATHVPGHQGDTFTVLQAVLDTQFWLTTHVLSMNLGYAATMVAGTLGVLYVLLGLLTTSLTTNAAKDLCRMIYGSLCFAILFSFFGSVTGGLWADDSWGRFWGWDPKENGALMIVLWNAVVLHARWGGIVKERGVAVMSIVGNIVTSWSWWGVNELGIGLHSYGVTQGVVKWLSIFMLSQLVIVALGLLPKQCWLSFRNRPATA